MKFAEEVKRDKESVLEWLEGLDNDDLVAVHNIYCDNINDGDNQIFENGEEFFEMFFDGRVMEAIRSISFGEYNYNHNYVQFNGYGNIESFDYPEDQVDLDEIADDILENEREYKDYIELVEEEDEEEEDEV